MGCQVSDGDLLAQVEALEVSDVVIACCSGC